MKLLTNSLIAVTCCLLTESVCSGDIGEIFVRYNDNESVVSVSPGTSLKTTNKVVASLQKSLDIKHPSLERSLERPPRSEDDTSWKWVRVSLRSRKPYQVTGLVVFSRGTPVGTATDVKESLAESTGYQFRLRAESDSFEKTARRHPPSCDRGRQC